MNNTTIEFDEIDTNYLYEAILQKIEELSTEDSACLQQLQAIKTRMEQFLNG